MVGRMAITLPAVKAAWKSVEKLSRRRSSECGASALRISNRIHGRRANGRTSKISVEVACRNAAPRGPSGGLTAAADSAAHRSVVARDSHNALLRYWPLGDRHSAADAYGGRPPEATPTKLRGALSSSS